MCKPFKHDPKELKMEFQNRETSETATLVEKIQCAGTPPEKVAAIQALANQRKPETIAALIESLTHHHPMVREAGVEVLFQLAPDSVEPLIAAFYASKDQGLQAYIIQTLARIADERSTDLLIEVVGVSVANHCQGNVRRVAARGLGEIGKKSKNAEILKKIITKLQWALETPEDWGLRYASAVSLQEIGIKEAILALQKALSQEQDRVVSLRIESALRAGISALSVGSIN